MKRPHMLYTTLHTANYSTENYPDGIEIHLMVKGQWYHGQATFTTDTGTEIPHAKKWIEFEQSLSGGSMLVRLICDNSPDRRANSVMMIDAEHIEAVTIVDPALVEKSKK